MLPQYAFLLLAQLVNLGFQAYAMRRLRSLKRADQLLQVGAGGRCANAQAARGGAATCSCRRCCRC